MKEIITTNDIKNIEQITTAIFNDLIEYEISEDITLYLELIIEEIFVNICSYAYEDSGSIKVSYKIGGSPLKMILEFVDQGIQFNPLLVEKTDIHLPVDEKLKGGLGILLTKEFADKITYFYKDESNILTIYLSLEKSEI